MVQILSEQIDLMKKVILAFALHGEFGIKDSMEESTMELLREILIEQ